MRGTKLQYGDIQIGETPADWGKVKVDASLVEVLGGFSCARSKTVPTGVPHLRPMNISTNGEIVLTADTQYIRPDFREDIENYYLQIGDILFNNTNSVELVGKSAIVREPMVAAFSNHINRLRVRYPNRIDPRWLALALRNLRDQGFFATHCNKWIGQAGFSISELVKVDIPIPYPDDPARSLETQRRIVARIEALFAELQECRKLHQAVVEDTNWLMEAAIRDVFGQPTDGWQVRELGAVAFIQTGTAKGRRFEDRKTVELPYLRVANVQAGYLDLDEIKTITIAEDEIDRYRLQPGDLLLTEGGDFDKLGRGAVWHGEIELCIHQNHIFAVRFDQDIVQPEFAEYEMLSWYAKRYFLSVAKKTTNLATINRTQLAAFPIKFPDLCEQRRIVTYLDSVREQTAELQHIHRLDGDLLAKMEQSILAQAFRGEL